MDVNRYEWSGRLCTRFYNLYRRDHYRSYCLVRRVRCHPEFGRPELGVRFLFVWPGARLEIYRVWVRHSVVVFLSSSVRSC
jgi:hypothetical protein